MGLLSFLFKRFFATPENLGKWGEESIESTLNKLNHQGFSGKILHNVYIPKKNGETTEIDVIFVSEKGIFVIESKNFSGYIFGNEKYQTWTSTLYAGKTWYGSNKVGKYKFYNPIWQNNLHIKYLKEYLTNYTAPAYSLIVFSNRCVLKDISAFSKNVFVCTLNSMSEHIKKIWNETDSVLSKEEINGVYDLLYPLQNNNSISKDLHAKTIQDKLHSTEICPWCGSKLVLRTARQGKYAGRQFYGCSNYPKCHYIKN